MRPETKKKMGEMVYAIPSYFHRFPDDAVCCMRCEDAWVEIVRVVWANQHGRMYLTHCPTCGLEIHILFDCKEDQDYWVIRKPQASCKDSVKNGK